MPDLRAIAALVEATSAAGTPTTLESAEPPVPLPPPVPLALFMSPLTAKTHVNRMMAKLGARDRAQLVVIAYETGLVRPGLS